MNYEMRILKKRGKRSISGKMTIGIIFGIMISLIIFHSQHFRQNYSYAYQTAREIYKTYLNGPESVNGVPNTKNEVSGLFAFE